RASLPQQTTSAATGMNRAALTWKPGNLDTSIGGGSLLGLVVFLLFGRRRTRLGHRFEGAFEHLIHLADEEELEIVFDFGRNFVEVRFVSLRNQDALDSCAV